MTPPDFDPAAAAAAAVREAIALTPVRPISPQRVMLRAMLFRGRVLIRHRDGFALTDGSCFCRFPTFEFLAVHALIKPIDGPPARSWTLTDAGRRLAGGAP